MVAVMKEIRQWVILAFAAYLIFTVAIPAINILLFAEQIANDALAAGSDAVTYVWSWWTTE